MCAPFCCHGPLLPHCLQCGPCGSDSQAASAAPTSPDSRNLPLDSSGCSETPNWPSCSCEVVNGVSATATPSVTSARVHAITWPVASSENCHIVSLWLTIMPFAPEVAEAQ